MANEQQQLNVNPADKPIFADKVGVGIRIKALKDQKTGKIEKEGLISVLFIDGTRNQLLGEFIINKTTAKELYSILNQTIEKVETELASKEMPKQPEVKTTGDFSSIR